MKHIGVVTKPGQLPRCVELLKTAAVLVLDSREEQAGGYSSLCVDTSDLSRALFILHAAGFDAAEM
jgi:hypothetical protein